MSKQSSLISSYRKKLWYLSTEFKKNSVLSLNITQLGEADLFYLYMYIFIYQKYRSLYSSLGKNTNFNNKNFNSEESLIPVFERDQISIEDISENDPTEKRFSATMHDINSNISRIYAKHISHIN